MLKRLPHLSVLVLMLLAPSFGGVQAASVSAGAIDVLREHPAVMRGVPAGNFSGQYRTPPVLMAQASAPSPTGTGSIVELDLPAASPYTWTAEKLSDGSFLFTGHLPAQSLRDDLAARAGTRLTDLTRLSSGAPADFATEASAAIDALISLEQGVATFDGAAWSLTGLASNQEAQAEATNLAQSELGIIDNPQIELISSEPYIWSATKEPDGTLVFAGNVPATSVKQYLAARGGPDAEDDTQIRADAPDSFSANLLQALNILDLLTDGSIAFDGENWSVAGTGATETSEDEVGQIVAATSDAWQLDISLPAEPAAQSVATTETSAAEQASTPATANNQPAATTGTPQSKPAPVAASEPEVDSAPSLAQCESELANLSADNAILFTSGAAVIADSAATELDAFAAALTVCPNAAVYVEGHTDSDGDAQANLALSVARAEAVVAALIDRGVDMARLYAVGFGESQPVADNATADGKRQNRRIVITLRATAI